MNKQKLIQIIKQSFSKTEILEKLGYKKTNTTQRLSLIKFIKDNEIDISHFRRGKSINSVWSDHEFIKKCARESNSLGTFLRKIGVTAVGSCYSFARKNLEKLNINITHFETEKYKDRITVKVPLEEIFQGKHPGYSRSSLKKRLLKEKIKFNICEMCGQTELWNNKKLIMELDHINGINNDNRLENLRMICPNCHSQTTTNGGRNRR